MSNDQTPDRPILPSLGLPPKDAFPGLRIGARYSAAQARGFQALADEGFSLPPEFEGEPNGTFVIKRAPEPNTGLETAITFEYESGRLLVATLYATLPAKDAQHGAYLAGVLESIL